jgi:hypothetical protein
MRKVTHEVLKSNIDHSYKHLDKFGRHSNFLGYDFIEIANIAVKKNNSFNLRECDFEDIRSEVLYELFKIVSSKFKKKSTGKTFRTEFYDGDISNLFNYFFSVAKRTVWKCVINEKKYFYLKEYYKEYIGVHNDKYEDDYGELF